MSDATTAAEHIRRHANLYKSLVDAADALERVGSVELAASEAQAARAVAESALAKAQADLADVQAQVKEAKDLVPHILLEAGEKAKADAQSIVDDAHARAQAAIDQANASAAAARDQDAERHEQALDDLTAVTNLIQPQFAASALVATET